MHLPLPHFVRLSPGDYTVLATERILEHYIDVTWILFVLGNCHGSHNSFPFTYSNPILKVQDCLLPVSVS